MSSIAHLKGFSHTFWFLNSQSVKNNRETYLSNLLKYSRNFWGRISASPALSVPDVCKSCFKVKYWNRSRFKLFWAPLNAWFGAGTQFLKIGGGVKLIAPKIDFYFFCARILFLARAKFLRQPLVTLKTFVFDRFCILFFICSKNALVKMGVTPPPHSVVDTFWLARGDFFKLLMYYSDIFQLIKILRKYLKQT